MPHDEGMPHTTSLPGVTERVFATERHTTSYLEAGPDDGPLLILCHGWPELSRSWRQVIPVFAGLGFRVVAPDLRGYGRSSTHLDPAAYQLEEITRDMVELLDSLSQTDCRGFEAHSAHTSTGGGRGGNQAIWVGHDWGAPVVWSLAAHHPDRVRAVASLCVPYLPGGVVLDELIKHVDRSIYPIEQFPAGPWEYLRYYESNFEDALAVFDSDVAGVIRALFRRGRPEGVGKPGPTAYVWRDGGWFRGGPVPELPQDYSVLSDEDHAAYTEAFSRNGFRGPNSWYINHEANAAYAARAPEPTLSMPVLFVHARYDQTVETVQSSLAEPMRSACTNLSEVVIDAGHWVTQEQPAAVNAALAQWIMTSVVGEAGLDLGFDDLADL